MGVGFPKVDPKFVRELPLQGVPGDVAMATAGAATVTYGAAGNNACHGVNNITVGFSATPTAPVAFTISDGVTVIFTAEIAAAGSTTFSFRADKLGSPNNPMVLNLPSGGSGNVGSVSVGDHVLETHQYQQGGPDFTNVANGHFVAVLF